MLCIIHKINNQIPVHFPFHLNEESVKTSSPDHYQLKAKAPQQPDQHCMPHIFSLHCHIVDLWDRKYPTTISLERQPSPHGVSGFLEFSWGRRLREGLMSRWWKHMERNGFHPIQTDLKAWERKSASSPSPSDTWAALQWEGCLQVWCWCSGEQKRSPHWSPAAPPPRNGLFNPKEKEIFSLFKEKNI